MDLRTNLGDRKYQILARGVALQYSAALTGQYQANIAKGETLAPAPNADDVYHLEPDQALLPPHVAVNAPWPFPFSLHRSLGQVVGSWALYSV